MINKEAIDRLISLKMSYKIRIEEEDIEALEKGIESLKNQKTGYWIRQKGVYGLADTYECSVCGRTIYAEIEDDLKDYPYCHCGAKMEGEAE